jgi:hypothetical protein
MKNNACESDRYFQESDVKNSVSHLYKEDIRDSLELYTKLLSLVLKYPKKMFVVPAAADAALHLHILHTRKFPVNSQKRFCSDIVHHNPEIFGTKSFWNAWEDTVNAFKEEFGIIFSSNSDNASDLKSGPGYCTVYCTLS